MTITVKNPILPGFNPDPAICRVGEDYYIATSTFEWYPGVQISHSKDLKNWKVISRPLNRPEQLNMLGNDDSCGIWAPCLTHHDGKFWLIYTDVKRQRGSFKDTHNYMVTCETIDGDWSDPIYMNSSGFDPSLFHDDDGTQWFVNMVWDYRPDKNSFGGIVLQKYDHQVKSLVGPVKNIYKGTPQGLVEGPHIYKRHGYYYLFTAEGGTALEHCETIARSKAISGPYETMPGRHLVTSKDHPENYLQRAGHGSLVDTVDGDDVFVHLCGRPIRNKGCCILGRETAIQNVIWQDDWPQLAHGNVYPEHIIELPVAKEIPFEALPEKITFHDTTLDLRFQWLRNPFVNEFYSLEERPGFLRLKGQESVGSVFRHAMLAIRQTGFVYQTTTELDFLPDSYQQQAGLNCYYNTQKYHYLFVGYDEEIGRHLGIMSCLGREDWESEFPDYELVKKVSIPQTGALFLRVNVNYEMLQFSWSSDGEQWEDIGPKLDASILSDEAGTGAGKNFTGAFVGMSCQDLSGLNRYADFRSFEYKNLAK